MDSPGLNLLAGWIGMLGGAVSGALIGLFFHKSEWMGGYASFRRRLLRLGHISFFGLGFLNVLFGLCVRLLDASALPLRVASIGLVVGAATMPLVCFLAAWRPVFRHFFALPVAGVLVGIAGFLAGSL